MPTLLTNPIYKPYGKSLYSRIDGSGILFSQPRGKHDTSSKMVR